MHLVAQFFCLLVFLYVALHSLFLNLSSHLIRKPGQHTALLCTWTWGWVNKAEAWLLPGLGTQQLGRMGRTILPPGLVFSNLPRRAGSRSANLPWPSFTKGTLSFSSQGNPDEQLWFGFCGGWGGQIKIACFGKIRYNPYSCVEAKSAPTYRTVTCARKQ